MGATTHCYTTFSRRSTIWINDRSFQLPLPKVWCSPWEWLLVCNKLLGLASCLIKFKKKKRLYLWIWMATRGSYFLYLVLSQWNHLRRMRRCYFVGGGVCCWFWVFKSSPHSQLFFCLTLWIRRKLSATAPLPHLPAALLPEMTSISPPFKTVNPK